MVQARPRRNSTLLKQQQQSTPTTGNTTSTSVAGGVGGAVGVSSSSSETVGTSLNDLFKNQSIKQIKLIKEKSDEEISIKQNQLRNLVGERYRDIIEAADCMESIQQLCSSSTNQFNEMTRLIDDYKIDITTSTPLSTAAAAAIPAAADYQQQNASNSSNLLLKQFSQIVDWMLNCVNSELYFYAAICFLAGNTILKQLLAVASGSSISSSTTTITLNVKIRELNQLKTKLIKNCKVVVGSPTNNLTFIQCACALLLCDNLTANELENLILKERSLFMKTRIRIQYQKTLPKLQEKLEAIESIFDLFYDTLFTINNLFKKKQQKNGEKLFIHFFLEKLIELNFSKPLSLPLSGWSSGSISSSPPFGTTGTTRTTIVESNILKKELFHFDLLKDCKIIPILYRGSFCKIYEIYKSSIELQKGEQGEQNSTDSGDGDNGGDGCCWKEWIENSLQFINQFITKIINETETIHELIEIKNKLKEMIYSEQITNFQHRFKIILEYCCGFSSDFDSERSVRKIFRENVSICEDSWKFLNFACKQQQYEILKKKFGELEFKVQLGDEISYSNIGEEMWKTPILDSNVLFDRFLTKSVGNSSNSNNGNQIFLQPITIVGSTREVRRKIRKELYESQLCPLFKEIFLLIQDLQNTNKEEHSELEQLIMTEYFKFYTTSIIENIEQFIRNPAQFFLNNKKEEVTTNTASTNGNGNGNGSGNGSGSGSSAVAADREMDVKLYCGRLIQSLRRLFSDLFIELSVRFSTTSSSSSSLAVGGHHHDESFITIMRKLRAQITNLKQKKKSDVIPSAAIGTTTNNNNYLMKYLEVEQLFDNLYLSAFNEWIEQQTNNFLTQVVSELSEDHQWRKSRRDVVFTCFNDLQLPFKTSFSVYNAVNELSVAIYSVGDFNVDRNVIEKLCNNICVRVFGEYAGWINSLIEKSTTTATTATTTKKEEHSDGGGVGELVVVEEKETEGDVELEASSESLIDDHMATSSSSSRSLEEYICEDGLLQLLFDVKYLGYVLLGGSSSSPTAIEKLSLKSQLENNEQVYVKAVSLILSFIDPINWETYEKSFNTLVVQCVNRNNLFTCNLSKLSTSSTASSSIIHSTTTITPTSSAATTPTSLGTDSPLLFNSFTSSATTTTDQDHFIKFLKPETINIPLLPIPKRDLKSYSLATSYNHHLEESEKDLSDFTRNGGLNSEFTKSSSTNIGSGDSTVFGSFVGSLQNLISTQPGGKQEEIETPSSAFTFNWF